MGVKGRLAGLWLTLIASVVFCSSAAGSTPTIGNPWLHQRGILNMAHQGGEMEAPSSTIYAFRTALEERGADSLEMDVNATSDGGLMVMHDYYTSRITPLDAQVRHLTAAQVQALDAAHWFAPGEGQFNHSLPDAAYPFRGVRTGEVPPPEGFTAEDFRVPTIEEVLDEFPGVPLNVEIKTVPGEPGESIRVAKLLAGVLGRPEYANRRIIVTSLDQSAIAAFHELAPHVDLGASLTSMIGLIGGGGRVDPPSVALQVPMYLGEMEPARVLQEMDVASMGYAVHAWTSARSDEHDATYARLIESGVQGIISSAPSRLADYLCRAGMRRPGGEPRCDSQVMRYGLAYPSRSLRKFLTTGLPVRAKCDQACRLAISVKVRPRVARRVGLRFKPASVRQGMLTIGTGRRVAGRWPAGSGTHAAGVSKRFRKPLSRVRRLPVKLTIQVFDGTGWKRAVESRWMTLRSKRPLVRRR